MVVAESYELYETILIVQNHTIIRKSNDEPPTINLTITVRKADCKTNSYELLWDCVESDMNIETNVNVLMMVIYGIDILFCKPTENKRFSGFIKMPAQSIALITCVEENAC